MYYFHLSYDNSKLNPKDIAELLRDKFNVTQIGRPVESALVFLMAGSDNDVARLHAELRKKFPDAQACFVISRVDYVKRADEDKGLDHIAVCPNVGHELGFDDELDSLNDDEHIAVTNLWTPLVVRR